MKIRRFEPDDGDALERLNQRLAAGGAVDRVYPEDPGTPTPERDADAPIQLSCFVARDDDEVRGSVWLKEQQFRVKGGDERFGWAKYPVAESLVDSRFAGVPAGLTLKLARAQPRSMALGLGGHGGPFARVLAAMRWQGSTIPFFAKLVRPARVLRHLAYLRQTAWRRALLDIAAVSGLGWLGARAASFAVALGAPRHRAGATTRVVESFGSWADTLWEQCRDEYDFLAVRSAAALEAGYPRSFANLVRLRVQRDGGDLGWLCVLREDLARRDASPFFGPLVVGLLADGLAHPADAADVVAAGVDYLVAAGVDLIVSNQSHPAWCNALRASGFLPGPSRLAFYRSAQVEERLAEAGVQASGWHINQGDCDGPSLG